MRSKHSDGTALERINAAGQIPLVVTPREVVVAAALRRRAQRIVDRVVAEAMENVRKTLKNA